MSLSKEEAKERLCLALDVPTISEAESIVTDVRDFVGVFKIGMQLFSSEGPAVVKTIQREGGKIFLDLKYHDIPNTVAEAGRVATRLGVVFFNIHASGGSAMMQAVTAAVRDEAGKLGVEPPKILAVTVLTSLSDEMLSKELNIKLDLPEQVVAMARLAQESGVDGVVASPKEIGLIREACGEGFIILTPGIRPVGTDKQDQQRVTTPGEAIRMGADYIVVGRPIRSATDRATACEGILTDMMGK